MNKSGEETILSLPERHNRILALLQQNGSISVVQLAELFKVSEVTIRKDLSFLEQQKKLYRTHGSAILISPYISDRHVNEKEKKNVAEKRAIGAKAASLVAQDDSIIIASGTTMAFLAREIKPVGHLTVITAAVPVTSILSQDTNVDVIQLGGITRSSSVSVVGPFAEAMLRNFNCSKLFVGVDGIDTEFGLTTTNVLEASLNDAMINAAQKVAIFVRPHKMPRRHFRCAKLHGKIQKRLELDFAIAQYIRVRRAPRAVFFEEVAEHAIPVFAGKIDRIVGNADDFAHLAHVVPIVFRRTYAGFVRLFPVLHEHADHVVSLLFKQQRRDRRIHAAGHAHHNSLAHASASISRWMTFSVMSRLTSSAGFAASTTMNRSGSRRMSS